MSRRLVLPLHLPAPWHLVEEVPVCARLQRMAGRKLGHLTSACQHTEGMSGGWALCETSTRQAAARQGPVCMYSRRAAQKARMEALAHREEVERAERQRARLQSEADAHARALAERDRFLRELAAITDVMDVRGTAALSEAQAAECAALASHPLPPGAARIVLTAGTLWACKWLRECLRMLSFASLRWGSRVGMRRAGIISTEEAADQSCSSPLCFNSWQSQPPLYGIISLLIASH